MNGPFWTGLVHPNREGDACQNEECINNLRWDSDGSPFDNWDDQIPENLGNVECFVYWVYNGRIMGQPCNEVLRYICELQCPRNNDVSAATTALITPTTAVTHSATSKKVYTGMKILASKVLCALY